LLRKIPLKSYVDFSVIHYIKSSVVALFSVKPMISVKVMSVKVMHDCIDFEVDIDMTYKWDGIGKILVSHLDVERRYDIAKLVSYLNDPRRNILTFP
jgi:hypothetical protein